MAETGDYQSPELSEQRAFSQAEYHAISQRMNELDREQEERGERWLPEHFYLNTQRRIIDRTLHQGAGPMTAQYITHQLTISLSETESSKNERAQQGMNTLRWAFLAYALPYDKELSEDWMLTYALAEQLNAMQREQMQQTGQAIEEVILDSEQTQTLTWMLDQVAIPHDLLEGEANVSLARLEQKLREATIATSARYPHDALTKDHEKRANVGKLMDQWKRQGNQES